MIFVTLSLLFLARMGSALPQAPNAEPTCMMPESSDNFDLLDTNKWLIENDLGGGGNWEFQWYSDQKKDVVFVKDGQLHIKPNLTANEIGEANMLGDTPTGNYNLTIPPERCTGNQEKFLGCSRKAVKDGPIINPVISAKLKSKFTVKPNTRVEVKAKLPQGDYLWPAVWFLPKEEKYGPWPASGEIDLIEARGNMDPPDESVRKVDNVLHFGPDPKTRNVQHGWHKLESGTFADGFHTFTLDWTVNGLTTSVDEKVLMNVDFNAAGGFHKLGGWEGTSVPNPWSGGSIGAPFDQEFNMILNVAVGGAYFNGFTGKPWTDGSETAAREFWQAKDKWYPTWGENSALVIDHIKSYPLNPDGTLKC